MIFSVELPEVVTGFGENEELVRGGRPEMLRLTELLPPTAVRLTVTLPADPRFIVSDGCDNETEKSACTFNATVVEWDVPVIVSVPMIVKV